jgi:carboxymethylenebutenolidase
MIPGIQPTGKYVELPHVVVMKFKGNKIVHEHIYWDQASLLSQIGLLDATNLPIK